MKRSKLQLTRQPQDYLSIKMTYIALPVTGNVSQVSVGLWPKVGIVSKAVTFGVTRSLTETAYLSRRRSDFAGWSQAVEGVISGRIRQYIPMSHVAMHIESLVYVLLCQTTAGSAPMRVKRRVVVAIQSVSLDEGEIWV